MQTVTNIIVVGALLRNAGTLYGIVSTVYGIGQILYFGAAIAIKKVNYLTGSSEQVQVVQPVSEITA
jgi:hypothetical protein